jgi:hypothetical protein
MHTLHKLPEISGLQASRFRGMLWAAIGIDASIICAMTLGGLCMLVGAIISPLGAVDEATSESTFTEPSHTYESNWYITTDSVERAAPNRPAFPQDSVEVEAARAQPSDTSQMSQVSSAAEVSNDQAEQHGVDFGEWAARGAVVFIMGVIPIAMLAGHAVLCWKCIQVTKRAPVWLVHAGSG